MRVKCKSPSTTAAAATSHRLSAMSCTPPRTPERAMEQPGAKDAKNNDSHQDPLYVAWTSSPSPSPKIQVEDSNGAPKDSVNIDVVVVLGLFDAPQSTHRPFTWLREYLDQPEADSRILHFKYHPSQALAPGQAHYGITTAAMLLLHHLTDLRKGGASRRIIFLAFDIGCIIVKKALTIASRLGSVHGQIFDACRTLVFFDCPHRSLNHQNMEDKLARLLYGRAESPSSQIRPTLASLPSLAAAVLEINESFTASKLLLRGYLISIHEDHTLTFQAWLMLERHVGVMGTPFERSVFCPRNDDSFAPILIQMLRGLEYLPPPVSEVTTEASFRTLPFNGERALLSLAMPTEPFTSTGHYAALVKLFEEYSKWLESQGTQILYVYSSKDRIDPIERTSEHVFSHMTDLQLPGHGLPLRLYYSFNPSDIRSHSLSTMIWTFLTSITSRYIEVRHYVPYFLHRLYEEQACIEADLLNWFEFFISRFDDVRLVINHFDVCPKPSRDAFLQLVKRIATKNDKPVKIFLTSREPTVLQGELVEWPSIDLGTGIIQSKKEQRTETEDDAAAQADKIVSEPPSALLEQEAAKPLPTSSAGSDALALSILLEQQLKRNLTTQEILQEATRGTLETYTLEAVLDRIFRSMPDQTKTRLAMGFLLFAMRPLSTMEFATIMYLGSPMDDSVSASPAWDHYDRLEKQRTTWFSGITLNKHSGVHFAHSRLEDALRAPETQDSSCYFWHEASRTAHYDIALLCLEYLTRRRVTEEQDASSELPFCVDCDLGFISYAVKYWPYHFSLAQSTASKEKIEVLRQRLAEVDTNRWSRTAWLLSNPFSRSRSPLNSPFASLVGLGYPDILEPSCPSDITSGVEEAARAGSSHFVALLLEKAGKANLAQSALLAAVTAASSRGDEPLSIELLNLLSDEGRDEISKRGEPLLFRAARLGLARLTEKLLETGVPVDSEVPYAKASLITPLCVASIAGYQSTVEVLVKHKATIEFRSHLQRTPLSLAASHGNANIIECLVKQAKADIEHRDVGDFAYGQSPFFIACEWGNAMVVETLVELGADPDKKDDEEWAPIIVAANFGHWRTIETLLDHGVDIETTGPGGHGTALRYALANGHIDVCRKLLGKGADPSSPSFRLPLLLEVAYRGVPVSSDDRITLAKLLLEHNVDINETSKKGRSALYWACSNQQFGLAEFLLSFDPDINIADKDGRTALYEATGNLSIPTVKALLERGADANIMTSKGNIPLHMCSDSPELTRLLVKRTKDVDAPMTQGVTQLMVAASKGWVECVKILLEHKANVNAVVTSENHLKGWTPVMFAAFHHFADILAILADAGADLRMTEANGASPLHLIFESPSADGRSEFDCLNALMEFQARIDIDQPGEDGETVLHRCAFLGQLRAVQRLVRAGASLTVQDKSGAAALGVAVWGGKREVVSYLLGQGADPNMYGSDLAHKEGPLLRACRDCDYTIAKMLIDHGADINCDSLSGFGTPLMAACLPYSDHPEDTDKLALHLLALGVDVNAKSRYVGSALAAAALSSRPQVVRALLDKGAVCDTQDELRRRPIHFAAINGEANFQIIERLCGSLSEVDILSRHVLHYAAQGGRLQVIKRLSELLPDLDINIPDVDGWTALCWVVRGTTSWVSEDRASEPTDPVGVVRYLLDRGADQSIKCKIGDKFWTPVQLAHYAGAPDEVVNILKQEHEPDLQSNDTGVIAEGIDDFGQRRGKIIRGVTCDACLWVCPEMSSSMTQN
ncbi:ankyrin repeat-containing domain protein [Xylaria palmicola]|nr:ankyrin repeat-containing domain protein [Xylaria palmicola]